MELEGLRGVAALAVVLGHFLLAFYPFVITAIPGLTQHMRLEDEIHGSPISIVFSGGFAVLVFFVLSGFVLTIGFFQTKRVDIIKSLASRRYLRLMLPALASIIICFTAMKLGLSNIAGAAAISQSEWLRSAWTFNASFLDALYNGTIGIFIHGASPYNNVLWTMMTEFLGSFLVFGYVLLFANSKYRWIGYVILCAVTFNTWYMGFIVGMVLADLYAKGVIRNNKKLLFTLPVLAVGIFFGSYPAGRIDNTMYHFLQPAFLGPVSYATLWMTIGAAILVYIVLSSEKLAQLMRRPKISILGKYTFSLYLVHLVVLYTVTTGVFVKLYPALGYNKSVLVAFLISAPVIWGITVLFEKYIDTPSINIARKWSYIFEGKEQLFPPRLKEKLNYVWVQILIKTTYTWQAWRTSWNVRKIDDEEIS